MNDSLYKLTVGALLHDIGKIVYRANKIDSRAHSKSGHALISQYLDDKDINEIILYHHANELRNAKLSSDSFAYIVCYADNVAAAVDRREIEGESAYGFDSTIAQASIFNLLNNNESNYAHKFSSTNAINFPEDNNKYDTSNYSKLVYDFKDGLNSIEWDNPYINSILELCEAHLSYIPSSTSLKEVADISLYDHQKLTAALATSIYLYLIDNGRNDFKTDLFTNEKTFRNEKAFLLFSCDISGIQQFIYTISSKRALKALRSRSFYLEILLEHIVDMLLKANGLSRVNLIYTGGGHAYILLPNTKKTLETTQDILNKINLWFIDKMGTSLFLAYAFAECSSNDLRNEPYQDKPYKAIFQKLSHQTSAHKLKRYQADEIKLLNNKFAEDTGRECKTCGNVADLLDNGEEEICMFCYSLIEISRKLIKEDNLLLITKGRIAKQENLVLPAENGGDYFLSIADNNEIIRKIKTEQENIIAIYAKNKMFTGFKYSTRLWMGNYYYTEDGDMPSFEDLAKASTGIERIAVMRADVDNLGSAFVSGFIREKESDDYERNKYLTISRTSSLSRQLSMFFKYHINTILEGRVGEIDKTYLSEKSDNEGKKAVIVYSGGDDMFIVGAWDEVIELALDLRQAFDKYTSKSLSFSAGIGVYTSKYPISRIAEEVSLLEKAAKSLDNKNGIALFGVETVKDANGEYTQKAEHLYNWDEFKDYVIGDKLRRLQKYFNNKQAVEQAGGNSFLYKLMKFIKEAGNDRINIARYAYLLSRMAPSGNKVSEEEKQHYNEFSKQMYTWILNQKDRSELLTAINIFVYLKRGKREEDEIYESE